MIKSFASALSLMAMGAKAAISFGECTKEYSPMTDFDRTRYQGLWFDIMHDSWIPFQWFTTCVNAEYTLMDDSRIYVDNYARTWFGWTNMSGTAVKADNGRDDASFVVGLQRIPDSSEKENYTVMDTDYDNYSIVYSCEPIWYGFGSWEYLWILMREPLPSEESIAPLVKIIEERLPDYEFYENTERSIQGDENCLYDTKKDI